MDLETYQKINDSFPRKLIFKVGLSAGFFSEYNNMILAMAWCLTHRLKFVLSSNDANFDRRDGWNGLFEPFCEDVSMPEWTHRRTMCFRYWGRLLKYGIGGGKFFQVAFTYLKPNRKTFYTQDVFVKVRKYFKENMNSTFVIDGRSYSLQELCGELIRLTWRYNAAVGKEIDTLVQSLGLPSEYVGFHIRRGDKFVEHPFDAVEAYFAKNDTGIRNLFVLTDDYSVISYIHEHFPDYTVYTLCEESEKGYNHADFLKQSAEHQKHKLIRLFASMDMLANAKLFVGTFSSNPGMYLGMRTPSTSRAVDFDKWRIW